MGSFFDEPENVNEKNIKITPHPIPEKVFFESIEKRGLKMFSDFSIDNLRKKAISLYNNAMKLEKYKKYEMLKSAIFYDNTNEQILEEYLKTEKIYNIEEYNKNLLIYYYNISPNRYLNITGEQKKNSSKDLLLEAFDILKNYKIGNEIEEEFIEKNKINKYFYEIKSRKPSLTANSIFSIDTNKELALYEAYMTLFSEINNKISSLWTIITDKGRTYESKLKKICQDDEFDNINHLIKVNKINEYIAILFRSRFFKNVLVYVKDYVTELEDVIKKCLELKDIKKDVYMLLFIIIEIKMIITHDAMPNYTDKIKNYITKFINNNESNTELSKYLLGVKNIDKYYINEISDEMKKLKYSKKLNELMLYKFIKLEYFNNNNIIQRLMPFITKFNEKISKSKTIIEALYELYPIFKNNKLFESDFIVDLFKIAIKKCYFFPFRGIKGAISLSKSGTLLFFIPNKTKIDESNLDVYFDRTIYLIGNLGVFIYIEFHEILGHFLRIILSNIMDYNFLSPRQPETGNKESGECIEFLLFGKRVPNFSVKQLIYLLDFNNYNKSLNTFKREFTQVDNCDICPSNEFIEMLREINIKLDNDLINSDGKAELFKENYISENYLIEAPNLYNCNDNYELFYSEDFEKLFNNNNMFKSN